MFDFLKKNNLVDGDSTVATVTAVKTNVKTDLNIIAKKYVAPMSPTVRPDGSIENAQIETNNKVIKFLWDEKEQTDFDNEISVFNLEIARLEKENLVLKMQREQALFECDFPKIDLSFLSMKTKNPDDKSRMTSFSGNSFKMSRLPHVPAYSVHRLEKSGKKFCFQDCAIGIDYVKNVNEHCHIVGVSLKHNSFSILQKIGKVFTKEAIETDEVFIDPDRRLRTWGSEQKPTSGWCIPKPKKEGSYTWFHEKMELRHKFNGVMPATTKKKIFEAMEKFVCPDTQKHNIFLIKECNDWTTEVITKDPLIVGIFGKQAYLIDHFDCTDMEAYARKEFTS